MPNYSYLKIARPDHWFKNVFMVPGFALGILVGNENVTSSMLADVFLSVLSTCLAASANYTINEWLDAAFDRYHPIKKYRPSVLGEVTARGVYTQWVMLSITSVAIATCVNTYYAGCIIIFLLMGCIYNIKPFRTKDRVHLDIISESFNNPLRFMLGWLALNTTHLPPSSILIAYWMGGAFLMAVKRYSEYRHIDDPETAGQYRKSFRVYTEKSLLLSAFFYALTAAFFIGIFLIKHRIEYIITIPFIVFLFVWYLNLGMNKDSVAQRPEKLYQESALIGLLIIAIVFFVTLTFADIPALSFFLETYQRASN